MKTLKLITLLFVVLTSISLSAQTEVSFEEENTSSNNAFIISPRLGYDLPFFKNNTPYVKYKGGLDAGISLDYYWDWIGVGADFDYIRNKAQSTYPTNNVIGSTGSFITNPILSEQKITRLFYGLGPDFRWQSKNNKLTTELNTRLGLGHVKGGRVLLTEQTTGHVLNFHAGYDLKMKFATKLQARVTYFFNDYFGINGGMYYLQHFKSSELTQAGYSSVHQPLTNNSSGNQVFDGGQSFRTSCDCNIYSLGFFAGFSVKIPPKKDKAPEECLACDEYALAVTARDKFTDEVLPNTDIAIKNVQGEIVKTGTTNSYGVVVFNDIQADNYVIEGLLHDVALDASSTTTDEFKVNETLQKEVIYSDESFILEGNAVVCNTTEGIPGVKVTLKNKAEGIQKSSMTDVDGVYILHVKKDKTYTISGKKDSYFSQTETINTSDFDRNTTLFVKLEICMEKADCGKALALQNINYDLDKYDIRPDARPELDRLVQFLIDNPTLRVEVSSHTDSRGSDAYNLNLSQNRATAAVEYVISQGVPSQQISGKGYGESMLLNECADGVNCSESKHQTNRRTEMKVICQ